MTRAYDDVPLPDEPPDDDYAWEPSIIDGEGRGGDAPEDNDAGGDGGKGKKPSHGVILRGLLDEHFSLIRSTEGRMFGVPVADPGKAVQHDAKSSPMIRAISRMFLETEGKWPSTTGVSEVSSYALAMFDEAPMQYVPLRCHWDRDLLAFYIDTCDDDGTVIRVDRDGVTPVDAPMPFRRSVAASPMPWSTVEKAGPADLEPLWKLVPVVEEDRPIALALLITTWMTRVPQPIVLVAGNEDSGKTSTARFLLSLVDPTTVERGKGLPKDERSWKAAVSGSRVVLVDNLSGMTPEQADLMCRVATGGEAASRSLYTDDAEHVNNLHIPVWLTSIEMGALRGDFASRAVTLELQSLTEDTRVAESELLAAQNAIRPQVTRGLLWLASRVMREWPDIDKAKLSSRMGDFAITVRCIDKILKTEGEARLRDDARDLAHAVVESDPLAQAVVKAMETDENGAVLIPPYAIKPAELLEKLQKARAGGEEGERVPDGKSFPRTPGILTGRLSRLSRVLKKAYGIEFKAWRSHGVRWVQLTRIEQPTADPAAGDGGEGGEEEPCPF